MKSPIITDPQQREALLSELAELTTLERGTLAEEYREARAREGGRARRGPYYKHQCWEKGRNRSRRVPVEEIERLRADLQNGQRFDQITSELAELAIAEGRAQRATLKASDPAAHKESKKNSRRQRSRNDTGKPKPSWPKSPRASKGKG